jgi:hypothetical protein
MLASNGADYQTSNHGRLVFATGAQSSLHPFKSRQQHALVHSLEHMWASTAVKTPWNPGMRSFIVLSGHTQICSFRCSHSEQSIGVIASNQGGHSIDLQSPIYLPGYVAFSHCWLASQQCTGAPLCWNHNFGHTGRGTYSSRPSRTVSLKSWYQWAASLSLGREASSTMFLMTHTFQILHSMNMDNAFVCKTTFFFLRIWSSGLS